MEITGDVARYSYTDPLRITNIFDNNLIPNSYKKIDKAYLDWRNNADNDMKYFITHHGIIDSLRYQIDELCGTIGNAILDRRMNQKAFVFDSINDITINDLDDVDDVINHIYENEIKFIEWYEKFIRLFEFYKEDKTKSSLDTFDEVEKRLICEESPAILSKREISEITINKKLNKIGKKVLKKSSKIFSNFLGQDTLISFLRGNEIVIQGIEYDFVIKKQNTRNLIEVSADPVSHTPYDLSIIDKNGKIVAKKLCIVFNDTPILDHIVALYLHIKAGEELNLIDAANMVVCDDTIKNLRSTKPSKKRDHSLFDIFPINPHVDKYLPILKRRAYELCPVIDLISHIDNSEQLMLTSKYVLSK